MRVSGGRRCSEIIGGDAVRNESRRKDFRGCAPRNSWSRPLNRNRSSRPRQLHSSSLQLLGFEARRFQLVSKGLVCPRPISPLLFQDFTNLQQSISIDTLSPHASGHIFRQGIRPAYQDPANRSGGHWVCCSASQPEPVISDAAYTPAWMGAGTQPLCSHNIIDNIIRTIKFNALMTNRPSQSLKQGGTTPCCLQGKSPPPHL